MKYIYAVLLSLLFVTFLAAYSQEQINLEIIYPKNNSKINAPSTFFLGNTNPKAKLTINNKAVKVYPNGSFVQVVDLIRGNNQIKIKSTLDNKEKMLSYTIKVPEFEKTIPQSPIRIEKTSITPDKDILYKPGDIISVKFKGSANNKASFSIGNIKDIPMIELIPEYSKTKTTFGKSFKTSEEPVRGIYHGVYRIQKGDCFSDTPIIVKLAFKEKYITETANGKITTYSEESIPIVAEVLKDNATVRTEPDKSRLTPLSKGTRLNITGKTGNDYRFNMGEAMEGWISGNDIKLLPEGTPLAKSDATSISTETTQDTVLIKIPLSQKLPLNIDQIPGPQMILTIYGATANIDLFPYNPNDTFIKEIKWIQPYKDTLKIIITPNSDQFWGYSYYYDNNTLVLRLKKPPIIDSSNPLKDKVITIDPGHGGKESGSVGPTGIPEKTINLAIAKYLEKELIDNGAKVIMTRTNDDENPDLYERGRIASANNSLILLSIHNNALPDGRNPYQEHGASTYYYHSQALPLAKTLQESLVKNLGMKNYGIFWDSLALTRPNEPIAVLAEVGFMVNPDEYLKLTDPIFQQKAAKALSAGLKNYFLNKKDN